MKKLAIFATLLTLVLSGCAENTLDNIAPEVNNEITLPDLTAGFADDDVTKTYVEESKYLRWHEADLITAFYGNTLNRQYKFKGKTGDNSGTFSLVPSGELGTGNTLEAIYAIYPYDEDATITDKGEISLSLPATQLYAENSFGRGANTMIAVTENVEDTFLGFKNACGYLKLKLYNESGARLKSVLIAGNNSEKIAGSATATIEFGGVPTVTMSADATTSVTLDCGEGIALGTTAETATELWVVLPEVTFEGGITITATDTEGITFEKSTTKPVAITRNEIQPMATLEAEFTPAGPANNEIWYTATAKVTPYSTYLFGANIVSNEWDEATGQGVITFDGNVTKIGDHAFDSRWRLASITIPDSVTEIGKYAFEYCSSLTSVTIGNGVTSIGDYAFSSCSSLTSIAIPDSVTSIGDYAFSSCSSLTSIAIPDSVTYIGYNPFRGCSSLPIENNILYVDTYLVGVVDKTQSSYNIKEGTRIIGDGAFSDCTSLTSITIPESVTSIGRLAFSYCSSLTSVTSPDGVTSIGYNAFLNCTSLIAFYGKFASADNRCLVVDGVLISFAPAGLTEYSIPDSVTSIGEGAFFYCYYLTSVTIPDSVTSIEWDAFGDCWSLASITIPDSVTEIRHRTFMGCISLTSVTIGNGVTSIGDYAFGGCESLTSVYCKPTTPPSGDSNMFDSYGLKIYVPRNSVNTYKSAEYWSEYADAIEPYVFE